MKKWYRKVGWKLQTKAAARIIGSRLCKIGGRAITGAFALSAVSVASAAVERGEDIPTAVGLGVIDYYSPITPEEVERYQDAFDEWIDASEAHEPVFDRWWGTDGPYFEELEDWLRN